MLGKANTHFAQNNVTPNDSNRVTFTHGICRNQKRGATVIITISRKYQLRKMWCSNKLFFLISKFTSSNRCYRDLFVLQNIPVRCFQKQIVDGERRSRDDARGKKELVFTVQHAAIRGKQCSILNMTEIKQKSLSEWQQLCKV